MNNNPKPVMASNGIHCGDCPYLPIYIHISNSDIDPIDINSPFNVCQLTGVKLMWHDYFIGNCTKEDLINPIPRKKTIEDVSITNPNTKHINIPKINCPTCNQPMEHFIHTDKIQVQQCFNCKNVNVMVTSTTKEERNKILTLINSIPPTDPIHHWLDKDY